jgi:hypothetical protein
MRSGPLDVVRQPAMKTGPLDVVRQPVCWRLGASPLYGLCWSSGGFVMRRLGYLDSCFTSVAGGGPGRDRSVMLPGGR